MGTAILRSHDCLQGRFGKDAVSIACHNRRRKRSPVASVQANNRCRNRVRTGDGSAPDKSPSPSNLVMGEVRILKRGDELRGQNRKARVRSEADLDLFLGSTNRFGPDPVTLKNQIMASNYSKEGIYAGSPIYASPPPSSVPVPFFLARNGAATSDLRRLLRLDR